MAGLGDQAHRAPELFLQDHAPGAVDPHAKDRMDHRVAAAHLVRERLDHDSLVVGHAVEDLAGLHEPGPHRRGGARVEPAGRRCPRLEIRCVGLLGGAPADAAAGPPHLPRPHGIRGAAPLTSAASGWAGERTTARRSSRERLRYGAAFWKRAWSASTVKDSAATAATTCWASTSSGASGITTRSSWRP